MHWLCCLKLSLVNSMHKINQGIIANRQSAVGELLDSILPDGLYFIAVMLFGYLVMILLEG